MQTQFFQLISTPVGNICIGSTDTFITSVKYSTGAEATPENSNSLTQTCAKQLKGYFAGTLQMFELPIMPVGSNFQTTVWNELIKIKYGYTCSYMDIAKKINQPGAVRAVGLANNKNPIAIIIPCHRVIGQSGDMVGYGGGLWRKKWLLQHEGQLAGTKPTLF